MFGKKLRHKLKHSTVLARILTPERRAKLLRQNPQIWHYNRFSVSGGCALGVFVAWLPLPFQSLIAIGGALLLNVNLPISVLLILISNPLTMPAMLYLAYRCGNWLLNNQADPWQLHDRAQIFTLQALDAYGPPLLLGCLLLGVCSATLVYLSVRIVWSRAVRIQWQKRIQRNKTTDKKP